MFFNRFRPYKTRGSVGKMIFITVTIIGQPVSYGVRGRRKRRRIPFGSDSARNITTRGTNNRTRSLGDRSRNDR